jgi:hypothetical protein
MCDLSSSNLSKWKKDFRKWTSAEVVEWVRDILGLEESAGVLQKLNLDGCLLSTQTPIFEQLGIPQADTIRKSFFGLDKVQRGKQRDPGKY